MSACEGSPPQDPQLEADARAPDPHIIDPGIVLALQLESHLPESDIRISGFLEIDDLDGTGPGHRDSNLCVQGVPTGSGGPCDLVRPPTDNPNYPGPDPSNPDVLGTVEADYTDWAHLDQSGANFHADLDALERPQPDDILKQGSCLDTGPSPSEANIELLGVAGNDDYLYLMMERSKTQGQEEFHFFFTRAEANLGAIDGCPNPSWLWDLEEGDVRVTIRFQSTSGLPSGEVEVQVYDDPDHNPGNDLAMTAAELIRSANWTVFAGPQPVFSAFNVAPGQRSELDEDQERDLDGEPLASGEHAEVAIDIASVFGQGCGLSRVMSVITTASGSSGDRDDLKDILSPVTVQTGSPRLSLDLEQECTEELSYQVDLTSWGDEAPVLGDDDLALNFSYACNGHSGTFNDDFGVGSLAVDIEYPVVCTVTAVLTGSGPYENCEADVTEAFTLYPDLRGEAALAQAECDGPWTWAGSGVGGKPPYSYEWQFSGLGFQVDTDLTAAAGTGSLLSGTVPAAIHGGLTVTDARDCEAQASSDVEAYHGLQLFVDPTTADQQCYAGDVSFDARIFGGTGNYSLAWAETGTADLLEPCASTASAGDADADVTLPCELDLGPAVCASGGVALTVTDPECGSKGPLGVRAEQSSAIDVSSTP